MHFLRSLRRVEGVDRLSRLPGVLIRNPTGRKESATTRLSISALVLSLGAAIVWADEPFPKGYRSPDAIEKALKTIEGRRF